MSQNGEGTATNERELTFGEKAVGLTFNVSNDQNVHDIKTMYAAIIDRLNDLRNVAAEKKEMGAVRHYSTAITEAETAQMRAVKAITAQMWSIKAITWKE